MKIKTIIVGGAAGKSSEINVKNGHAFTNVSVISNLDFTTYTYNKYKVNMKDGKSFECEPLFFSPICFRIGGIVGSGANLNDLYSSGTVFVNTNTKINQSKFPESDSTAAAASTTHVGGIAGLSGKVSHSSFSGDIIVADDGERSTDSSSREWFAAGFACAGGIVGGTDYYEATFNGLYAKGNITIEPKCNSNAATSDVPAYGGGIAGCSKYYRGIYIINSYADMALTLEPSSCLEDTFRRGGITSITPIPSGISDERKHYIVNNHASATFAFPKWG